MTNSKIFSKIANQEKYPFNLPELPYAQNSFEPHFTSETFEYHHGKHHNAYVTNLNKLLESEQSAHGKSLEQIILEYQNHTGIFNNAAQIWNHSFFWHSISPKKSEPSAELRALIDSSFGSLENFKNELTSAGATQFGSGWAWLTYKDRSLHVVKTANAGTPITDNHSPLLCLDVWEHAYYIDYRNKRPAYLDIIVDNLLNWDFANENLQYAKS